jgi:hypothetical protein
MQSKHLILLFISILEFSSFSFSQGNEKSYEACDDMTTSLSFVGGCLIGEESQNNMHQIYGLSLEFPMGKKFYIAPEYFTLILKGKNYNVSLISLIFRYRVINSKIFTLSIQSGLGCYGSRSGLSIPFQVGLKPEFTINDNIKIGIDCRLQPIIYYTGSLMKFYTLSLGIVL